MDSDVVAALFAAMGQARAGGAGMFRIEAANPEGIQGVVMLALDEVAYLQYVEPALRAGKVEVVKVRGAR
jgi:hypothetical protein